VWWAIRAARAACRLAITICCSGWWRARRCSTSRRATSKPASRARGGTRFSGPTCATPTSEWVVCLRLELITRRRRRRHRRRAQTLQRANLHYKWVSSWAPALCTRASDGNTPCRRRCECKDGRAQSWCVAAGAFFRFSPHLELGLPTFASRCGQARAVNLCVRLGHTQPPEADGILKFTHCGLSSAQFWQLNNDNHCCKERKRFTQLTWPFLGRLITLKGSQCWLDFATM